MPGKLRRAVLDLANAVYAERASRNEPPPHRVSRCLASTRVRRALFDAIAVVFPLDNIFRRARLVGRKNSRDPSRHGVEAASRIFASAPLRFGRPRDPPSLLESVPSYLLHWHNSHIVFHDAKSRRRILGKSFAGEAGGRRTELIQWLLLRADSLESIVSRGDDGESVSGWLTKVCERPVRLCGRYLVFSRPPRLPCLVHSKALCR